MRRKRFSTEEIIKILKKAELSIKIKNLCSKYGMSEQTFYSWCNKSVAWILAMPGN
jgi:putative transposase